MRCDAMGYLIEELVVGEWWTAGCDDEVTNTNLHSGFLERIGR